MADSQGVLRQISWRDLCPWLVVFRTFGLSISLAILGLGSVGAILTPLGWKASRYLFLDPHALAGNLDMHALAEAQAKLPSEAPLYWPALWPPRVAAESVPTIGTVFRRFVDPYRRAFSMQRMTLSESAYLVAGMLWMVLVWSILGGAIVRIAVVQLGREETVGIDQAVWFSLRKIKAFLLAVLYPLIGVALLSLPCILGGLLLRLDVGVLLTGLVWIVFLLAGLGIAVLLLGLLFGWPLMWGAITAEEEGDEFEAMHRSYSYTFQRPLHYLFYAALALILGILGSLFVITCASGVLQMTDWAVSWGSGYPRMVEVNDAASLVTTASTESTPFRWGTSIIRWWRALVHVIVAGFHYSYFWCAAAAIYLLLRRDVDHAELDEVFTQTDRPQPLPSLPPIGPKPVAAAPEAPAEE